VEEGKFLPALDLMSSEQWKGLLICLLYAGTSTAISMVNKVRVHSLWRRLGAVCTVLLLRGCVLPWFLQPRLVSRRQRVSVCMHASVTVFPTTTS
jgi:hypothetical protein